MGWGKAERYDGARPLQFGSGAGWLTSGGGEHRRANWEAGGIGTVENGNPRQRDEEEGRARGW